MGKKKKIISKDTARTVTEPGPVPPPVNVPKSKVVRYLQGVSAILLILFLYRAYVFYHTGYSGYANTLIFYALLLCSSLAFIPTGRKALRINAVVVLFILFVTENYLRFSGKGYLNHTERNNMNIFGNFISPFYDYSKTRFFDQLWVDTPNKEGQFTSDEFSYSIRTNELGLRERPTEQFRGKRTIVVLGDSFTFGHGTSSDSTCVVSLEAALRDTVPGIWCYNGGSSGSDICYMYKLFEKKLRALDPEVVILNLNKSDIIELIRRGGDERFADGKVRYTEGPKFQFLYSFSYIFRVISRIFVDQEIPDDENRYLKALDDIQIKIGEFQEMAEADGFRLMVVFTPMEVEWRYNHLDLADVKAGVFARYPGVVVLDLLEYFRRTGVVNEENVRDHYYRTDLHFTPKGYWLWGSIVADTLVSAGWVK